MLWLGRTKLLRVYECRQRLVFTFFIRRQPATASHRHTIPPPGRVRLATMSTPEPHIPRPLNAFFIYRRDVNKKMKATSKQSHQQADVSKAVAAQWQEEPPEVRMEYQQLAKEAQEEHQRMYPNYRYNPGQKKNKHVARRAPTKKEHIAGRSAAAPQIPTPTLSRPHRDSPRSPQMWTPKQSSQFHDMVRPSFPQLPSPSSSSSASSGRSNFALRTQSSSFSSGSEQEDASLHTPSELGKHFRDWRSPPAKPYAYQLAEGTLHGEQFFPDGTSMGLFLPPQHLPFGLTMPASVMEEPPTYYSDARDDEKRVSPQRCPRGCRCHKRPLEDLRPRRYQGVPYAKLPGYASDGVAFTSAEGEAWFDFRDSY